MIQGTFSLFAGISGLIIGGANAVQTVIADGNIVSESTGITLGLVTGAIVFVAVGAWRLANYVSNQEARLKRIEEAIGELELANEKRRH